MKYGTNTISLHWRLNPAVRAGPDAKETVEAAANAWMPDLADRSVRAVPEASFARWGASPWLFSPQDVTRWNGGGPCQRISSVMPTTKSSVKPSKKFP